MLTTDTKRQQLIAKLREMFQMDQADLDFGIYRIMNAKRVEVEHFLEHDLLPTLRSTLEAFQPAGQADKQNALEKAIEAAKLAGFDPEQSPKVRQLREEQAETIDLDRLEEQVYSDLHTFFSRYYQNGDFMSLRRYKEGVYALPYEGEEVKLHWANADQYYIKSAENFTRYAFKTSQGRVRFELAAAGTERDNNKATGDNERRFILAAFPLELEAGELIIRFEYRSDPDKRKQKELNTLAVERLLHMTTAETAGAFPPLPQAGEGRGEGGSTGDATSPGNAPLPNPSDEAPTLRYPVHGRGAQIPDWPQWRATLAEALPTDKNKTRSVLEKHLSDYTAKNTFDYFIHKDLGRFLRRELDFFIKNEVMHLDDIEEQTAPAVEQYLARIKAMRRIAHKLIAFLAQLENFQKKLWLKKKFVLETNWLITLDRINARHYPEICRQAEIPVRGWDGITRNQREEWVKLFAIDDLLPSPASGRGAGGEGQLFEQPLSPYSIPLTPEFLQANPFLVLDTAFIDSSLKDAVLADIENLDEQTNGLLVHGENYQAINLIGNRYQNEVDCFYIDPPYNTGGDGFAYKDNYQHSSWLSMLQDRLMALKPMAKTETPIFISIDDNEVSNLRQLLDAELGETKFIAGLIIQSNKRGQTYQQIAKTHEYVLCYSINGAACINELPKEIKSGALKDDVGFYELWELRNRNPKFGRFNRPNLFYPIYVNASSVDKDGYASISLLRKSQSDIEVLPLNSRGEESCWRWSSEKLIKVVSQEAPVVVGKAVRNGGWNVYEKARKSSTKAKSIWLDTEFISEQGTTEATSLGIKGFGFPKPTKLVEQIVKIGSDTDGLICDFFAGSGTTAHAVINCNREVDEASRRYLLIEVGDHFDNALKPRVQKSLYSSEWNEGRPKSLDGFAQVIKYLRLESYEDTCDNLALTRSETQQTLIDQAPTLREGYYLNYLLDMESRASLLNLDKFNDPFNVALSITRNDETREVKVDLPETFNYLLGLRVKTQRRLKGVYEVTGTTPAGDSALILWRDVREVDNDALDTWFRKQAYNTRDMEFDLIYVNGDNNLENLRRPDETWKVRLTEEAFHTLMFAVEEV